MIDMLFRIRTALCVVDIHEDDDADGHEDVILMMIMGLRISQKQFREPGGEEVSWCCIMTVLQQSILGTK